MFLLAVDAHSKWLEVAIVNSATSTNTVDNLRMMFSTHGLPEVIVSDNGTAFSSEEFSDFTCRNNIRHIRIPPYHPSSNGQVERAVQTFKDAMGRDSSDTLQARVARFLFTTELYPIQRQVSPPRRCWWEDGWEHTWVAYFLIQHPV